MECRVFRRHGIVEDDHYAVAREPFERAAVFDYDFADGRVIVAQQSHHVFRVVAFREPSEPTQITEERGNLSPMAFELLLRYLTPLSDQPPAEAESAAVYSCARFRLLGR